MCSKLIEVHIVIYRESKKFRQLIARLDRNEELLTALHTICTKENIRAGRVQAIGTFSSVVLIEYHEERAEYVTTFEGQDPFDIVSLSGNVSTMAGEVSLNVHCAISWSMHGQVRVVAGKLKSGLVSNAEMFITAFDDLVLERAIDPSTGLATWSRIQTKPQVESESLRSVSKTPVAIPQYVSVKPIVSIEPPQIEKPSYTDTRPAETAVQNRTKPAIETSWTEVDLEDEEDDGPALPVYEEFVSEEFFILKPGDVLIHPKLGRVTVERVEEDEWAYIRLKKGYVRKLSLELCRLTHLESKGSSNVYRVEIRKP